MIEDIHAQLGYKDLVLFINNEITDPLPGRQSEIIAEIVGTLPVKDYWCFVQELYTDQNQYYGVYFVSCFSNKITFIRGGRAVGFNYLNSDCNQMFLMGVNGIAKCYSDVINLYDPVSENYYGSLQISKDIVYGSEIYFSKIRSVNQVLASGLMQAILMQEQLLTCYNLKIDLTPYATVSFKSAKNMFMNFDVEVAAGIFEHFTYSRMGVIMRVQDTEWSRRSLKKHSADGIVFIDF